MKSVAKFAFGAFMLGGAALAGTVPAAAHTSAGISFGFDYPTYADRDPCAYYDDYDVPPWGLPPGYCGYPVYYGPVYWGGDWYRGPIYYRAYRGRRVYWLNGGWRHDEWHGRRPGRIEWRERGYDRWRGGDWHGGHHR